MNRLDDQHIHLLIDEPIYVLAAHGDHPTTSTEEEDVPVYSGNNEMGICIFAENALEDDFTFLFKGLNALAIGEKDVAIFEEDFDSLQKYPEHTVRLRFSEHVSIESAFEVQKNAAVKLLNSIRLVEIRNNQDFKRKFWEALKLIFE